MDVKLREKNLRTVQKVMEDALGTKYPIGEPYATNARFVQPFFFPEKVSYINQQGIDCEYLCHEETCGIFSDWAFGESELIETTDPNVILVRNSGTGKLLRADGTLHDYSNDYVHLFRLDDGLIVEYYEYTNPLRLMDAMGIAHPDLPTPEETSQAYSERGLL